MKSLCKMLLSVVSLLTVLFSGNSMSIDQIQFITEEYPPYNFKKDGKLQGVSIEVVNLMLKK